MKVDYERENDNNFGGAMLMVVVAKWQI